MPRESLSDTAAILMLICVMAIVLAGTFRLLWWMWVG